MTTGERIKEARIKCGLTQKELGERLGLSYQAVAQWENNLRHPKPETLARIADAIGIDVIYLLSDEEKEMHLKLRSAFDSKNCEEIEKLLDLPKGSVRPITGDELKKITNEEKRLKFKLLLYFNKLTLNGKRVAIERVKELSEIAKYSARPTSSTLNEEDDIQGL